MPTFPGINSCAKTKITENAEAMITPMITANISVQNKLA